LSESGAGPITRHSGAIAGYRRWNPESAFEYEEEQIPGSALRAAPE
jgi:hypothetical protein